jgi:hypothetical protein
VTTLRVIRASLVAARDAGCDDLVQCADAECLSDPVRADRGETGDETLLSLKDRRLGTAPRGLLAGWQLR